VKYERLQRKYHNLDALYKEARRQNAFLSEELRKKSERWRQWYEWYQRCKDTASPVRTKKEPQLLANITPSRAGTGNEPHNADQAHSGAEDLRMDISFRTSNMGDDRPSKHQPETQKSTRKIARKRNTDKADEINELDLPSIVSTKTDLSPKTSDMKSSEVIEIPESPVVINRNKSIPTVEPVTPLNLGAPPRPKSAPAQTVRPSKSVTPISTSSTGYKKKRKKNEHPNIKYWTEDGTDGMNPLPGSPSGEDDGVISAMLEGRLPSPPGFTTSSTPNNKVGTKVGRVRELVQVESDIGSDNDPSDHGRDSKRLRVSSEPRSRRQLLSPDLAARNKGKGRYATSVDTRYS